MNQIHTQSQSHQLTRDELFQLNQSQDGLSVSLFMPTHRTGKEIRQDPIRLKNLVREAERQLTEAGNEEDTVQELLSAVKALPESETRDFWQHNSDGLAVFSRVGYSRVFRVPVSFSELVVVANRFHTKPLLNYFQGDGRFYLLAVSSNRVRLLEGTKHHLSEVDTSLLPNDLQDALNIDEYQSSLQFHSYDSGPQAGSATDTAMYHGHHGSSESEKKEALLKFFRHLDDGIQQFFGVESTPLVFAGVEYLFPIYRQANNYRNLFDKPVTGNFDDASREELHKAAWKVVEPSFTENRAQLVEDFGTASAHGKGSDDLESVVRASREGRVETLLLSEGVRKWGKITADSIEFSNENSADTEDLLDFAAVQTLQTGGNVYLLEASSMPTESAAAAIFRY